ncbi:MAG: GldM family protein [Pseudomonadota bacterium]
MAKLIGLESEQSAPQPEPEAEPEPQPEAAPEPETTVPDGQVLVPVNQIGASAYLSRYLGGPIGNGEFKAQGGLNAQPHIETAEERACSVIGYDLTYIAKRQDPIVSVNQGARYNAKSQRMVRQAKPGDVFTFSNVRVQCDGDSASRRVNSLVFFIR